jgi:hypothetical protein
MTPAPSLPSTSGALTRWCPPDRIVGLPPEVLTRTSKLERIENRAMAGPGRPKTGGRQKGTRNKVNQLATKRLEEMAINGKDPVTFFSQILQDQNAPYQERKDAAKELLLLSPETSQHRSPRRWSVARRQARRVAPVV